MGKIVTENLKLPTTFASDARAIAYSEFNRCLGSKSGILNAATDYRHIDGCPKCPFFRGFII